MLPASCRQLQASSASSLIGGPQTRQVARVILRPEFAAHESFAAASIVLVGSTFAQTPSPSLAGTGKRPFTFEDMMALKRLSEPVPSPDGKWVVFAAEDVDLEANTKKSHLWIVPASGGESRRLNETPNEEERPQF